MIGIGVLSCLFLSHRFPNVSPYLSPYRPGAGQWWGMDPARGRPASRQGYTFGSNATGVGVESVAGASVRVGLLVSIQHTSVWLFRLSLLQLQVLPVSHPGKLLPLLYKVCIEHNTVIIRSVYSTQLVDRLVHPDSNLSYQRSLVRKVFP